MSFESHLSNIMVGDKLRLSALDNVKSLELPDCWIGAGFVRDAIWDRLHGRPIAPPFGDVEVIWFDVGRTDADLDRDLEARLKSRQPGLVWSVKNQARMHLRNHDAPYSSVADAMRSWPETATAVAVRQIACNELEINAPLGLADLFMLRLVPTAPFRSRKPEIFERRVTEKRWLARYPLLTRGI